jgi:SulP family sulfate permease
VIALRARAAGLLPRRADYDGLSRSWRSDVVAGLSVAVVALPLALGFGVTSGMGASAGLITAIVAGAAAALFGGSNLQVSGPTGAMTVVLVPIVARYGTEAVFAVGLVAGAIVTLAAAARLGRLLAYIPWPVIEGFTVGIAAIIFLQQVPAALGVARPEGENTAVVAVRAAWRAASDGRVAAVGLVLLVAALMVGLPRIRRSLPASLVAVAAATVVAELAGLDVARTGALPGALPAPSLPGLGGLGTGDLVRAAIAVAALAAIESLLSAKVADGMADTGEHDPDRELFGQGIANLLSPLFGGMPATGAIARTAVNVRAGARTRLSSLVHALTLLVLALFASSAVELIPLASLAGVLMVTAARMVERHNVLAVLRSTRSDATVLVLTAAATIAFDLLVAIEIGVAVAAVLALRSVARSATAVAAPVELDVEDEHRLLADRIVTYRLDGALFFGAAQRFLTELTNVTDVDVVILRLPDLQVLDATGARALGEIVRELEDRGITVLLKGMSDRHERILRSVGALAHLADERHVFDDLARAVAHARSHVERRHAIASTA